MHRSNSDEALICRASPTLASRLDYGLYAAAWLVFAAAFGAVFWLQRAGSTMPLSAATFAVLRVVLPAALLGIGVVRWCERIMRPGPRGRVVFLAHAAAALVYPAAWIAIVNVSNNVLSGAALGSAPWRYPPDHVLHWHAFTGVLIYLVLAGFTYGRAHIAESERQRLIAEARLLRGQLDPHFLFNTMHSVFALARLDAAAGEDAVSRFSRLMRFALGVHRDDRETVALGEEWAFSEDYLYLAALRLECRVRWTSTFGAHTRECAVPPLLLQPLVENAVKHAGGSTAGVNIHVAAWRDGQDVIIRVSDDGPGTTTAVALGSRGIGIRSVRTRVASIAPRSGTVTIETRPGYGFAVTLRLPVMREFPMRDPALSFAPFAAGVP
jgi:anti-sigma regulatory factor (Ser/Thr protein kinase)